MASLLIKKKYPIEDTLWTFLKKTRKNYQSPEFHRDKRIISAAYEAMDPDAPKINFEKNLSRIIEELPEKERKLIWQSLEENLKYNFKPRFDFQYTPALGGGRFFPKQGITSIEIPQNLEGTDVDYFIRLHEAYHLMIHIISNEQLKRTTRWKFWDVTQPIRKVYLEEMGAMAQEWYYFASMPQSQRIRLLQSLEDDPGIGDDFVLMIENALKEADSTPSQHVMRQHLNKRYDKKSIRYGKVIRRDMGVFMLFAGPVFAGLGWTVTCVPDPEKARSEGRSPPRFFCEQHPYSFENRNGDN